MKRSIWLIIAFFFSVTSLVMAKSSGIEEILLDGTWTVKGFEFGMGMWKPTFRILLVDPPPDSVQLTRDAIPAQVPGTVRKALLKAGVIPDPYVEEQAKQSLWVEEKEWWFVHNFEVPESWKGKLVTLECNMINYRADVWINQVWCGVTQGNYLRLKMDVEQALKYNRKNIITIRLRPPVNSTKAIPDLWFTRGRYNNTLMRRPWVTPTNPQNSEFLISSCLFGWDWGTHIVPTGIPQPIRLVARNKLQLEAPFMITRSLTPERHANMEFSVTAHNRDMKEVTGKVKLKINRKGSSTIIFQKEFLVTFTGQESKTISDSFTLMNPELWWPIPLGERLLYEMSVSIIDSKGNISDQIVEQFGVRTLKKVPNEDPHWLDNVKIHKEEFVEGEYNWTFVINGEKIFVRGVNWIPVDAMLDLHPERYRYLLRLAAQAGVNMLRVWGEGLFETDTFYDLCDSLGIMVWQDFWIGSYSPAQSQDKSWEAVVANIQRARNRPSLVLYCGGNEFDASRADRVAQIDKLKELCEVHDGTRDFHKASPYGGDEHGGMGITPKVQRRHRYWRFISEGGYTQSWPPCSDLLKFMKEEHLFPIYGNEDRLAYRNSRIIRHPRANDTIYGVPRNLDELIHIEILHNIIGWQSELENTRLEKYKVSGCLFWAHNDVWPTTSCSMVDYYGTAKNHYYAFKRAAQPLQVTASQQHQILKPGEKYDLEVCVINDYLEPKENLTVKAAIYLGEKGTLVYKKEMTGLVKANSRDCIGNLDWTIPSDPTEHNFLLRLELYDAKAHFITRNEYTCMIGDENRSSVSGGFFGEYHNWSKNSLTPMVKKFPAKMKIRDEKSFTITYKNTTPNVVMGLETLITDLPDGVHFYLDDNYIHLLPEEERTLNASLEISDRAQISGPIRLTLQTDGWNVKRQALQLKVDVIK